MPNELTIQILKENFSATGADPLHFLDGALLIGKVFHQESAKYQIKLVFLEWERLGISSEDLRIWQVPKTPFGILDSRPA
jgi:hypothetical protein